MKAIKILLVGFCGNMGQAFLNETIKHKDVKIVEGFDKQRNITKIQSKPKNILLSASFSKFKNCDVVVDFSNHLLIGKILKFCIKRKRPLVIGTTGFTDEETNLILDASKSIPIFISSNMSEGVFVLLELIKQATHKLKDWDIEVIEKHHSLKKDAPSGTAVEILKQVKEIKKDSNFVYGRCPLSLPRQKHEIGVHSVRGGGAVGEHHVQFFNNNEVLTLSHEAFSKQCFASGAVKAVKFISKKKLGLFKMKNLF